MSTLWIRADGSATLGLGHLLRTVAVAEEAVEQGLDVVYVVAGDGIGRRVAAERGFAVVGLPDARDQSWVASVGGQDLVVFDGYQFMPSDFSAVRSRGAVVAAVDDLGSGTFPVDVLLNQNLVSGPTYDVTASTRVLVGPRYALVRREFRQHRRERTGGTSVLVLTFGGSDIAALGPRVVDALEVGRPFERVVLVLGPSAADIPEVSRSRPWLSVVRPADIASVFDTADAVIAAAGSTTWELLCMGLPVALVEVTSNQRYVGPGVGASGAGLFLGSPPQALDRLPQALAELADPRRQEDLAVGATRLVDGLGAKRFFGALRAATNLSRC